MMLTTIYKAEKKYSELIATLEQFKTMTSTLVNSVRERMVEWTFFGGVLLR